MMILSQKEKSGRKNPDKISRWVGFVQGILFMNNPIEIEEERNSSRKSYKPIYQKLNMTSTSIEVERN